MAITASMLMGPPGKPVKGRGMMRGSPRGDPWWGGDREPGWPPPASKDSSGGVYMVQVSSTVGPIHRWKSPLEWGLKREKKGGQ